MNNESLLQSDNDLEAIILHENSCAFAAIINKDLYRVLGSGSLQQIQFHNQSCFDLFCIHVFELFHEKDVKVPNRASTKLSLFSGAKWVANRHAEQSKATLMAIEELERWLSAKSMIRFWCGDLERHIEIQLSRRDLLRFSNLISKHNLLGLNGVLENLNRICATYNFTTAEIFSLLGEFIGEIKQHRLLYLSSSLVELLHDYFTSLNEMIGRIDLPESSAHLFHLQWATTNFARGYNREHYSSLRPTVSSILKARY